MNVAIVTDSNSGIFEEEGKILGVHVIPMPVILEGKTYYEGIDLAHEEFYQCLEEKRGVFSSQPSPAEVLDMWDKLLLSEYDELVYIPMSSGLSGSCQTAQVLAQDYEEKVQVVDNHRISVTQRQSVLDALMLKEKGCSLCRRGNLRIFENGWTCHSGGSCHGHIVKYKTTAYNCRGTFRCLCKSSWNKKL